MKISFWNVPHTNHWTNGICVLDLFFGRLDGERLLVGFMQEPGSAWVVCTAVSETWVLFFITEYKSKEGLKFQIEIILELISLVVQVEQENCGVFKVYIRKD